MNIQRWHLCRLLFICLLTNFLFISCRKTISPDADSPDRLDLGVLNKRFFTTSATVEPEVLKLAAALQQQHGLIENLPVFVRKNGLPNWEKVFYKVGKSGHSATGREEEPASSNEPGLFLVPLQGESDGQVQSYITAYKHSDSLYTFRLYNKDSLNALHPSDSLEVAALRSTIAIFAYFEQVINHTTGVTVSGPGEGTIRNASLNWRDNVNGSSSRSANEKTAPTEPCLITETLIIYFEWRDFTWGPSEWVPVAYYYEVSITCYGDGGGSGGGSSGGGGSDPGSGGGWYDYGTGYPYGDPYDGGPNNPPYGGYDDWYPWTGDPNAGGGSGGGEPLGEISAEPEPGIADFPPDYYWWDDYTTDFPAQLLPSWADMNANYPKKADGTEMCGADVYQLIGGQVLANMPPGPDPNACAARLSRALNYSGVNIPAVSGDTYTGADGKNYYLSAAKLYNFMLKTFKIPPNPAGSIESFSYQDGGPFGQNFPSLLAGKKGIYAMKPNYPGQFGATGHMSLYNGSSCVANTCNGYHDGCYFGAEGGINMIYLFHLN